jgi:hypothetical protein
MIVGLKLWVNNHPRSEDCLILTVSVEDWMKASSSIGKLGAEAKVTDLNTGRRFVLRRSECGLPGCVCALRIAAELPRTTPRRVATRLKRRKSASVI